MKQPDFSKGLLPAIVQDASTGTVLMLAYMNHESYDKTLQEGRLWFYSRSRNRLWLKGESSANYLYLKSIAVDCDADTLLIQASPAGPVCHTGSLTCFENSNQQAGFIGQLEQIIRQRAENPSESSYTSSLFKKGINKIAQKVGEEAVELVIEAKDQNENLFLAEAADLLFHYLILLRAKDFELNDVIRVLENRHKPG